MTDLIKIENKNGQLLVSSRQVAEHFEKRHSDILIKIDEIIKTDFSVMTMFSKSSYTAGTGKAYKEYLLTRDGFTLLAMGFTGEKALQWKLKYIDAFNKMEQQLKKPLSAMELLKLQNSALIELDERVDTLEEKVEKQIRIDCGQQRELQKVISQRAYERVGQAYPKAIRENVGKYFRAIYKDLKNRFGVASYRDININDFENAVQYVQAWIEPSELRT